MTDFKPNVHKTWLKRTFEIRIQEEWSQYLVCYDIIDFCLGLTMKSLSHFSSQIQKFLREMNDCCLLMVEYN